MNAESNKNEVFKFDYCKTVSYISQIYKKVFYFLVNNIEYISRYSGAEHKWIKVDRL